LRQGLDDVLEIFNGGSDHHYTDICGYLGDSLEMTAVVILAISVSLLCFKNQEWGP
jgi:hypothetical protein